VTNVKVSIVIPLYNKAPYVERALASIGAQSFTDFEVIVVDDGSTDNGPAIVRGRSDPRIRLLTQSNAGPGPARNTGIAAAAGEFITFLDADDEWLPTFLEESVRLLEEWGPQVACVSSGYIEYPSGLSRETMWLDRGIKQGVLRVSADTSPALVVNVLAYMSPWSTMVRADVIRKWKGFYSKEKCLFAEDAFLWLKVLFNEAVGLNLQPLARFHKEASGLSNNLPGARPVEPFLIDATEIEAACPPHLQNLLAQVLAIRAAKTACVLGYWGHWREAKVLMQRFTTGKNWRLPYFAPALVCSTPLGAILGKTSRTINALIGK
jgi:glycosyltransferase involved in cell wall biosynthesis